MRDVKSWYQSKTIIGGIVAVAAAGASLVGINVHEADQASLTNLIVDGAGVVGGLLAIVGRLTATRSIGR